MQQEILLLEDDDSLNHSVRLKLEREGYIISFTGKGSFVASKNTDLIKEEHLKEIEGLLQRAVELAFMSDVKLEELKDMLILFYKEK